MKREVAVDTLVTGAATIASVVAGAKLVGRVAVAGDAAALAAASVYAATLVIAYAASTMYHLAHAGRGRAFFQALDHTTIFLLIAGTYTPFCVLALRYDGGMPLLAAVWALGLIGIGIRLAWLRRAYRLAPLLYLLQGWIGVPWAAALVRAAGTGALILVVAGGVAYTAGIAFYLWRSLRYGNLIWHLFVIAGSACHYAAIARYLIR